MNVRWREVLWPEAGVWLVLMALLCLTLAAGLAPLGPLGTAANLAIAAVMALLVAAFFMHLRHTSGLNRLASALGPLWLAVLLLLTLADVLSR